MDAPTTETPTIDGEDNELVLRIASWNIQTLGKKFLHGNLAVLRAFAEVLLRTHADLIALMEVMEKGGCKAVMRIAAEMCALSGQTWLARFPGEFARGRWSWRR